MESSIQVNSGWAGQLLHNVIPVHYNLTLRPEINQIDYTGHLDIRLDIRETTSQIILNAEGLNIYNVQLRDESHIEPVYFNASNIELNKNESTVLFTFPDLIPSKPNIFLTMEFNGKIDTDSSFGFYRSSLKTKDEKSQFLLSTQFESDYARRAFPCWDEPEFKATFEIRLEVDNELTALSNNEILSSHKISSKKKRVVFKTTPKMSTYLVAFAVGELEFIEASYSGYNRSKPVRCRIYTLPGYSHLTHFSMNATLNFLEYYEKEFKFNYQLNKLDLIAVPNLAPGAMENWGLITFQHNNLVTDEFDRFNDKKIFSVYAIAHELAHQWFGNLVTIKWWSDIWLNESLASYFGLIASDKFYPDYNFITNFRVDYFNTASDLDLNSQTSSILRPLKRIDISDNETTVLIYVKGVFVMSMLNEALKTPVFMKNICHYLHHFQYQSVSSKDFYSFMLNNPELEIFKNWVEKPGYPILEINERNEVNSDFMYLDIKQSRFGVNDNTTYYMKFYLKSFAPNLKPQPIILHNKSISLKVPRNYGYLIETGLLSYFHVQYPYANLQRLSKLNLSNTALIRLMSDIKILIKNDEVSEHSTLQLFNHLDAISDPLLIQSYMELFDDYFEKWSNFPNTYSILLPLQKQLYQKIFSKIGYNFERNESETLAEYRKKVIIKLAQLDDQFIMEYYTSQFKYSVNNFTKHNSTFISTIFTVSLMSSDPYYYQTLLNQKHTLINNTSELKFNTIEALAYTNTFYLKSVLEQTLNLFPDYDAIYWLLLYLPHQRNYQLIYWEFIKERWIQVKEIIEQKQDDPLDVIKYITSHLIKPEQIQEITDFVELNLSKTINITTPYYEFLSFEPEMIKFIQNHQSKKCLIN